MQYFSVGHYAPEQRLAFHTFQGEKLIRICRMMHRVGIGFIVEANKIRSKESSFTVKDSEDLFFARKCDLFQVFRKFDAWLPVREGKFVYAIQCGIRRARHQTGSDSEDIDGRLLIL